MSIGAHAQVSSPEMRRLHEALNLTTSQESAWQSFEQAFQIDPQELTRQRQAMAMSPGLNAPRRIDISIAQAKQELDALQRRGAALKLFYGILSPHQQTTFDRETLPPEP